MKGNKGSKADEKQKYLYAEPKFMIPPDPLTLPEPFKNLLKKEETQKKKEWVHGDSFIAVLRYKPDIKNDHWAS